MLTKELRQEALKKGFHYPKVEKSVEFYRTKNLMIYDFVCEESAVVRVCISKQHAGIYDVLNNIWKDCTLENYLEDPNQFTNYILSERAKKLLKTDSLFFDSKASFAIDAQIRKAKNWKKINQKENREKEIKKIMAGTNKPVPSGFKIFSEKLLCSAKRIMYSAKEKSLYCPECGNTFQLPDVPKKGSLHTCPACGYSTKVSSAQYLNDIHWSCIVQAAGKRSIIRYFCNELFIEYGKCSTILYEKYRTIVEEDGSMVPLMQTSEGWKDYKGKNYSYFYTVPKREVPNDMYLYGTVEALMKMPALKNSMLDVWVKQHIGADKKLCSEYLVENYIKVYAQTTIYENLLKHGLNKIAHEAAFYYDSSFHKNEEKVDKFLNLTKGNLDRLREFIPDPSGSNVSAMRYLEKYNVYLKDDELKTFLRLEVSDNMKEQIVKFCKCKKVTLYKINKYVTENANADWSSYFDYIGWTEELDYKKSDSVYYPKKFFKTHDRVFKELEEKKDAIQRKKDKEISKKIADLWEQRMQIPQYHYENNDLFVMMPHGTSDLKKEGRSLNHCVAGYKEFVAEEKTQIFFIRKKAAPQKSFYTLEIKNHDIEQCHGKNNVNMTEEIRAFAYGFLNQLKTIKEKPAVRAAA